MTLTITVELDGSNIHLLQEGLATLVVKRIPAQEVNTTKETQGTRMNSQTKIHQLIPAQPGYYALFREETRVYAESVVVWAALNYPWFMKVCPLILDTLSGTLEDPSEISNYITTAYLEHTQLQREIKIGHIETWVLSYVNGDHNLWVRNGKITPIEEYPEN